jgi:hypothetical protein
MEDKLRLSLAKHGAAGAVLARNKPANACSDASGRGEVLSISASAGVPMGNVVQAGDGAREKRRRPTRSSRPQES